MCRLFAAFSVDRLSAESPLLKAPQSLLAQSTVDVKRRQGDGWGVGWFSNGKPQVLKSPRPIYRDRSNVRRAASVKSRVLLGHVRWASNPMKLPRHELIGFEHTQPFEHGDWLFVHNGTLFIPQEVKAALEPVWSRRIKGENDSEVLFYWLLRHLQGRKGKRQIAAGVRTALRRLERVWASCQKAYPIYKFPFHGMNWVLTNGDVMIVSCLADPRGFGQAKALCRPDQPYYQLQYQRTATSLLLASEPLDPQAVWVPFRNGQLMIAERKKETIVMHFAQVA